MQSSTGQYSTQAGDPAHPVQHSVITASSLGFFLRGVVKPLERGSNFISSGTIPGFMPDMAGIISQHSAVSTQHSATCEPGDHELKFRSRSVSPQPSVDNSDILSFQ